MGIKLNYCKLEVCFFFSAFVLLQSSAYAVGNPRLLSQQEVETHGNDVQVSEARCWQMLDEMQMDEDLREKSFAALMSLDNPLRKSIINICSAFHHKPKSFVKRMTQLLTMREQKSGTSCVSEWVADSYGRLTCKNELGQAVFKTLPVARSWARGGPGPNTPWTYVEPGIDYVDVNGDGLADVIISYHEWGGGNPFYRATFLNDGKGYWIMIACETNSPAWSDFFAPCQ